MEFCCIQSCLNKAVFKIRYLPTNHKIVAFKDESLISIQPTCKNK